jgi:type VI protein secretion system component Hcp
MIRRLSCLLVMASMTAACGMAEPEEVAGDPTPDPTVNALEASGRVEFFVTVVGANGDVFNGESRNAAFRDAIPAIRYFSDVNKAAANARTRCTVFRFTKVVGAASPQLVEALASGETLQLVHFDFVRGNTNSVFQEVDLEGVRISKVEQAVAPPEDFARSMVLEEVSLVPTLTATVTLTANPLNADGSAGTSVVSEFDCRS